MKKMPVTIKAAWIGFGAVIIAAIFSLISSTINRQKIQSPIITEEIINNRVSDKIENQTNNYFPKDTTQINDLEKKVQDLENKIANSNPLHPNNSVISTSDTKQRINIENMSGGVVAENIENLNIITKKEVHELLPFDKSFKVSVSPKQNKHCIEIKVLYGEWSPFIIGIPSTERSSINPTIYDSKSTIVPGISNISFKGLMTMQQSFEISGDEVNFWLSIFQEPVATPKNSLYIDCSKLPTKLIFGVYPDNLLIYEFGNLH